MSAPTAGAAFEENLRLLREDVRERRLRMRSKPTWLGVILTTRCNLRCAMCGRVRVRGELPPGLGDKLRPLYPTLARLNWQGGEVFVHQEFPALLEEAARHPNLEQYIVTAGVLIDRAWAERLVAARAGLTFSIDAATPATYARIRTGARLEQALHALDHLAAAEARAGRQVEKTIHAVVMRENAAEVSGVVRLAASRGIGVVDFSPRLPLDDDESLFAASRASARRGELERLLDELRSAAEAAAAAGIQLHDRVRPLVEALLGAPSRSVPPRARAWDCLVPWTRLFVNAEYHDGDIMPDCMCTTTPIGHIATDELLDVWNGERMQEYRRRVLAKAVGGWCNAACTEPGVNPAEWFSNPAGVALA